MFFNHFYCEVGNKHEGTLEHVLVKIMAPHEKNENVKVQNLNAGFPTGVENMWGAVSFPLVGGGGGGLFKI